MSAQTFNISLPKELVTKADRVAKIELRTRSELIREALRSYIEKSEDGKWKTIVDFTKINPRGVPADDILYTLKQIRSHESNRKIP